ncbi:MULTISPECIES: ABC transporter substrate-binding protein [Burkholderia]|uniref:ABC transporter substrate-binding protein n=1 Tax=Burkholderia savannae TaxID=1637837 RepID=A0ABR5T7T2_9BURK|nr:MULTISPECIES: ABC transporter substrate-binding protein [Burkholderia]AOJ72471.1 ABC transporter substrate-binding protein [Burkholderia savannae]AOJ82890.1 ABC transporter substrate-binding protein [Burkholderia savannae]AOK50865.1 ABC transporter substrate-binding protein [Burkholderia sp. MSMB617WGS]KGR92972.1 bacterial extracellular solute-binding s, 5 Middle family protein [Burkholderia sp. ABCPW 111]KVG46202.1 ABC transporter substrate-binding protein [Burkholderia sp. MSMB0265]
MSDEIKHGGFTRRDMMRVMAAGGVLATGAAGGLLAGARSAFAAPAPKRGGKIRVAYDASSTADTLDPAKGSTGADYIRCFLFYSGLTQLDESLTPQPNIAESVQTKDAKTWVVKLRRGVTFHDGKPLAPADVVYSLTRHKNAATASKVKSLADQFADVKATGPNEVTLTLDNANADLPVILATPQFVIVKDGTTDFSQAIGTGPYKLKSFKPGVSTVGVRNDGYWKSGAPYLDQIELIGIGDAAARVNALLSGDVQLINGVDPRSTQRVASTAGFVVKETKSGLYTDLILRRDNAMTGNMDFVNGMKYLFDREQIRSAVFRGYSVIANDQPIPPGHRYFNASLAQRPFDLDRAKFHFQKAGAIGTTLPPIYATTDANGSVEMAVLLQQTAAKIGVNLTVNRVPADGYWSNHWMKHPIGFGSINPRSSADVLFTQFFKSDATWNESGWKNPKFDQLLLAARSETDEAKRKQMYGEMQALVSEQGGIGIPAFISLLDAHDKRLKGLGSIPTGALMGFQFAEHVWWEA